MSDIDKKTKNKPVKTQLETLVEFMERNKSFAMNELNSAITTMKWQELTDTLNKMGPPLRSTKIWQRTWTDLQRKADERWTLYSLGKRKMAVSKIDERVIAISKPKSEPRRSRSPLERDTYHPPTIDLTSESNKTHKVAPKTVTPQCSKQILDRKKTKQPAVALSKRYNPRHSLEGATQLGTGRPSSTGGTGANTSAVITAMNKQTQLIQETVENLLTCFEAQNEILRKGFEDIGQKLLSAVEKTVNRRLDDHINGGDTESMKSENGNEPALCEAHSDIDDLPEFKLDCATAYDGDEDANSELHFEDVFFDGDEDYLEETEDAD